jgi:hypothetical protein
MNDELGGQIVSLEVVGQIVSLEERLSVKGGIKKISRKKLG